MKTKLFLAAAILFAGISNVSAQAHKIQKNERHRIKQGVRSGELTKAETIKLAHQQKDLHQDVKQAKSDGVVTPIEKKEIKQEAKHANRSIYRLKHNKRDRN